MTGPVGPQELAVVQTIEALRDKGQITGEREAQAQMLIGLAAAVDANPDRGALWREYRIAESAFRASLSGSGDALAELMAALEG